MRRRAFLTLVGGFLGAAYIGFVRPLGLDPETSSSDLWAPFLTFDNENGDCSEYREATRLLLENQRRFFLRHAP